MLQPLTLTFLKNLAKNNHKDWFEKNRALYEAAKADYLSFVSAILNEMKLIDPTLESLEPKQCVFRINRDVRFSKNKDPYKTNMGCYFNKGGKKIQNAGYYFHCEPDQAFIAGGLWMPMGPDLKKVRQEIDYNFDDFKKIVSNKKFKTVFGDLDKKDILLRKPKDYEETNPAIEYLKLKSFIANTPIANSDLSSKTLVKKVVSTFETMKPLIDFLNRGLEG